MAKNAADVLKSVPLFQDLSKGELKDVAAAARDEVYSPGQDIVTQGQSGGPFFCITEGQADVYIDDRKVADLGPGSYFGEMALFEGGSRTATVRAETHVKALAISSWNFLAILQDNWDVTKKIFGALAQRVHELERKVS
jgi:voltage-gated potassium channel